MIRNKSMPLAALVNDLLIALVLLTRLPLPQPRWPDDGKTAYAAWAYPLAGLVVASIGCAAAGLATSTGLAPALIAALLLASLAIMTGAMHEDGLADCADGFWGGWTPERRLEIMKDSTIGVYGMLALLVVFLLRWTALTEIITMGWLWAAVIPAAIMSRAAMVWIMADLPNARGEGLSARTGRPSLRAVAVALIIAAGITVYLLGDIAFWVFVVAALSGAACRAVAKAKIGGQTGDVLGATQYITETAILIALTTQL